MIKTSFVFFALCFMLLFGFSSCHKETNEQIDNSILNLPNTAFNYTSLNLPTHLTSNSLLGPGQNAAVDNDNTPSDNPTTNEGATLGRVLFYDKKLSANGSISCASCHKQNKGFADDAMLSLGFEGGKTRRHSMSLVNARWYGRGRFFWDERAETLEKQVLMPFQDTVEMGMTLDKLVGTVQAQSYYQALFMKAFGSKDINADRISKALAQFVRSIVSVNSKYDAGRKQVSNSMLDFPNFTSSENNGKTIFFGPPDRGGGGCIGCHSTEAFINPNNGTTNNGLDATSTTDLGVFEAINNPNFLGAFKVPSLKNIALTSPYMHDGRFATLEQVVEHYNSGVKNHPNLANVLRDPSGMPIKLNLSPEQKTDLVNFLKTLTDETIATDERFSDPFKK